MELDGAACQRASNQTIRVCRTQPQSAQRVFCVYLCECVFVLKILHHIEKCFIIQIKHVCVRVRWLSMGSVLKHTSLWRSCTPYSTSHRECFICSNFSQYLFTYLHFEFAFDMVHFWFSLCGSPNVFNVYHIYILNSFNSSFTNQIDQISKYRVHALFFRIVYIISKSGAKT